MKIIRYQTPTGQTAFGRLHTDGRTTRLAEKIFGELTDNDKAADLGSDAERFL